MFNVSTPNIREDLKDEIFENFFDFSTLDHDDVMYDASKESKVGFWKIETGSDTILSSTGIRPKVYSLQYVQAKMLRDINERLKIINIEMRKMKKKVKCARQFTYRAHEMKKLKVVYSFTQHKKIGSLQDRFSFVYTFPLFKETKHFLRRNKNVTNTTLFF